MKPFYPWFDYTPRWKGNRARPQEDQFTVRLRDFSEAERLRAMEELDIASLPANTDSDAERATKAIVFRKKNLAFSLELAKRYIIVAENLTLAGEAGETISIGTGAQICELLPDLALEIAARLLAGADEEELKN